MIKFFSDDGMCSLETIQWLKDDYGKGALFRMHVHYRTQEVTMGRTDFVKMVSPGMAPDGSLSLGIANKIEGDPLLLARKVHASWALPFALSSRGLHALANHQACNFHF
jgi:hypothetical protein